jgi:hypothetical protein
MHFRYPLRYLFEAVTAAGEVIAQDARDWSRRFPEIDLMPLGGDQVLHRLHPDQHPELVARIEAGEETLPYAGQHWLWRTRTAMSDLQEEVDRRELAFFILRPAVEPGPTAMVRLLPIEWVGLPALEFFGVGDIWVLPGHGLAPIVTPFSLPSALWPVDADGQRVVPPLQLVYGREVTVKGESLETLALHDVAYQLGWKTSLGGQDYQQVVALR